MGLLVCFFKTIFCCLNSLTSAANLLTGYGGDVQQLVCADDVSLKASNDDG